MLVAEPKNGTGHKSELIKNLAQLFINQFIYLSSSVTKIISYQ